MRKKSKLLRKQLNTKALSVKAQSYIKPLNESKDMTLNDKEVIARHTQSSTQINHTAWTRKTERRECTSCKAIEWISPLEAAETEWICPVCETEGTVEIEEMFLENEMAELSPRMCV